jgi:hypothetical protein
MTQHRNTPAPFDFDMSPAEPRQGYAGVVDAEYVIWRLEEAGMAAIAMPLTGFGTGIKTSSIAFIREAMEGYGWNQAEARLAVPSAATITRMDEAFGWLALIPQEKFVLRRIVGARSLVNPRTGRHLFAWRRIGVMLGSDHRAAQRWHAQGIDLIVRALNRPAVAARHLRTLALAPAA